MEDDVIGAEDSITLHLDKKYLAPFFPLLQKGVAVKTPMGVTVTDFLCGHFGLSPQYVKERIQTIFLDGEPVDDEDSARVRDGTVLALSSAMPGLLGATLRKGSPLRCLRREISHREKSNGKPEGDMQGTVTVKLFNFMIPELAGAVLELGIWLDRKEFGTILEKILEEAGDRPLSAERNHGKVGLRELMEAMAGAQGNVFLRIETT
jgi:hypothetical protein